MAGDKFDQLYNALKADGAVTGTREHFRKFVYAPGKQGYHNRKQLYDALHADGAVSSNSYEEFAQRLGLHAVNQKPQQKPVAQKPMTTAQRAMKVPRQYQRTQLVKAPKSASPFVQSLYDIDDEQKGAGYPVDYTSPKATQQVYQRNQRIRRQAAKTAAKKINRQASHAQPIMQTNTPADTYIGKTEGQLMDEMNQSANALVGSEMGDYLDKVIGDEFKAAHARGLAALSANSGVHGTGGADWWIGERAYQNQMDQDKQLQEITGNIQKNIESIFSNQKVKQRVLSDAQKLGVSPETYIESSLAPALIEKAGKQFNNTQLNRMMAKGASDYIASGILNSLTGTLLAGLTSTKSQRQMQQQADAMTEEGLNPNYKPGTWAKAAKGAVSFAADAPWYNLAGVGAGALTEKVFGNAARQMARVANQSLRQRVFEGVARGIVHGGATGFQYGTINGAVQNYSTGEDTSLLGTLKAAVKGGLEEGVSFATMEGMGGAVGAFGHGIGLKGTEKTWKQRVNKMGQKLTYEGIKTGMEGIGMATGGVASSYANHILTGDDWHGFSTEGTLESCASAVIFKLTHAKDLFKKETDRNGKPFSFTSNIAQKTARFFLSGDAKSAPHVFSDEEKHQLFAAGSELGMKPMENIVSWAKQAKKYRAEDIEKSEDGSDLLNNYQQIMLDPNVSWDAKAKFTTMVMGTMPESRPMMDHISYGIEDGTDGDNRIHTYKTVNEYAADGTLLSKHRFDTKDKMESIIYEIGVRKEELRSKNALALLVCLDRNNYDLQNSFFKKNAKDWEQVQEIVEGMQTGGSKIDHQFTEYVLNSERGSFLPIVDAVASKNGMDRESVLKAFDKDPMKRSDAEQNACVLLRKAIEMSVFPANKVHEEQSVMDGKDVATDNNLGTEQPNGGAVKAELDGLRQAEAEMDELMRYNDVFGQNFQKLKQQGLTNPQIYDWMVQQGGLTVEQLEPFAHYINANARVQGMQEATKNAIDEQVSSYVQDWSFHGTLNGQEKNGEQAIYVQDSNGRTLLVGTGEVAFDTTTGRAKEGVGDMLVCLDPKSGETVYVKSDEVKFVSTQSADDFANGYRQELQMKNSEPYNQAAQEQAMQDAAKPQPEEKSKDDATKGGDLTKDDTTLTKVDTTSGKDNTPSEDLVPQEHPQQKDYRDKLADLGIIGKDESPVGGIKNNPENGSESRLTKAQETLIEKKVERVLENPNSTIADLHDAIVFKLNNGDRSSANITVLDAIYKVFDAYKRGEISKEDVLNFVKEQFIGEEDNPLRVALEAKMEKSGVSPQEQPHPTRKFADGSDVPMTTDSKGRPTPDYEKMTPEQSAEILAEDFGENVEKVVDGQIQKAEKALKDAEKMKVDYTAEPNDIMEQEALKKKTVEAAKKQLEHAQNIKKTMTAKKVAEAVGNTEQTEGAHEAGSVAAQKFENAPRLVGNKRTRMLPDGETKIKGHYEIVPAESLTPSHDVNNGYKKSEGFPTDAEGRTVNDRDYEHDKAAQQNTDQIARKYNGMAIEQVPVVSDEGIVYDGNGRTMAGQKAAKEGTDGEYINDLLENAENFGFTREQIEHSGIEHPRLVLVTDERLPYDTSTFSKFNRNEKKTQSNTEQAVAKAKTLTSDEVGAIVAEIEGSGSLDAFFNNSKAINDLVKTLVDKGIIGQNEVAQMMDSPERLSAQGREYVKNLLLGSIFKPETIRMLGIDSTVKNKAINAIRSVMDNMKLGEFSLRDEIDQAIQLLYEARQGGNKVDTLLRTQDMFGDDAAKRYPSISQMMALALEGKVTDFRDLLDEYNRIAASRNTGEGNMFEAAPTKEELINEYLNFKKWQDYGTGHSENEGGNDVSGIQEPKQEASGGNEPAKAGTEPERTRVEEQDDLVNKELESRIKVTDEETETPSKNGPIMKQKILIDGDKEVIKVDEPNEKGEYTGSYYEYDGKKYGDLNGVLERIDDNTETSSEEMPEVPIYDRKKALLEEIEKGGIKKKDDAFQLLYKAEDLVDDYYGIPHDEWRQEPSRSNTIDGILSMARNKLDRIENKPVEPASERQLAFLESLTKEDPTTRKMLEGAKLNKRQASWLIGKIKGLDDNLMSLHPDDIAESEKEIHDGIEYMKNMNGETSDEGGLPLLPREEKPDPQFNPIESASAEFKKEHPLTEEEIMKSDVDDLSKDMALDYLNGEVTDDLHRAIYESIYAKRKELNAEQKVDTSKTEPSANPIEEIKNAAEGFEKEKKTKIEQGEKPQQKADDAAVSASNKKVNDLWKELMNAGKDEVSSSFIGLNSRQLEVLPKLVSAMAENAYLRIKRGMHNLEDVVKEMRKEFAPAAKIFKKEDVDAIYEQMMNIRYRDGEQRMILKDWADYYEKTSPKHQENLVGDSKTAEERKMAEKKFMDRVNTRLGFGQKINGIVELRKMADECGLKDVKDTDLQELAETAIVQRARGIASSESTNNAEKFKRIKKLYENQPSLNQRDSERVMKQQYSTPAPYAFLADMYVNGNGKEIKSALEPSAGNGMLTIGLPKDAVHVNDIDAQRLENLRRQGFKNVTSQDGTQPFADKDVDVVVTNPPFGSATPKEYDGYKISSLEGQMAINALESMKDDGRAAIIIGGKTEYAKNGSLNPKDKAFLGYLYSHYNVEDVINVDGSLYAKQGTSYPTRIILINGRRNYDPENKVFPPVEKDARAETVKDYDELYKRIEDDILRSTEQPVDIRRKEKREGDKPSGRENVSDSVEENGGRGRLGTTTVSDGTSGNSEPTELDVQSRPVEQSEDADGRPVKATGNGDSNTDGRGGQTSAPKSGPADGGSGRGGNVPSGGNEPVRNGNGENGRESGVRHGSGHIQQSLENTPKEEKKQSLTTEKVKYQPHSSAYSIGAVVPARQKEALDNVLNKLGDADQYLVDNLGYNDKEDLYAHLAAEQIDAVALGLKQMEKGNGFIIGDQTGIGKGRQAAAIIRYAVKQGRIPISFTQKANLFSDTYRDLNDIGSQELRPFILASSNEGNIKVNYDEEVKGHDGKTTTVRKQKVVYKVPSKTETERVLKYIAENGKLPEGYDYILTTYSQIRNGLEEFKGGKWKAKKKVTATDRNGQMKRDAIKRIAENSVFILDESHDAAGEGSGSAFIQDVLPNVKGVTFLSATYAKTPDAMKLYALKTDLGSKNKEEGEKGDASWKVLNAIKKGGAVFQEIMSQALTKSGQMIRRERDMTGVTIDWNPLTENEVEIQGQRDKFDNIFGIFNDILNFQRTYVDAKLGQMSDDLALIQGSADHTPGTKDMGIGNVTFASKAYNVVQQALFSIKAEKVADYAIEAIKNGEKPVIAVNNTMGSMIDEYPMGVEMDMPDLNSTLMKGLEGILRYTEKNDMGDQVNSTLRVEELGEEAVARYNEIKQKIASVSSGLSISPIDVIKHRLEEAGYKVGELTGRNTEMVYTENGKVIRKNRTDKNKNALADRFNNGDLDALILNRSAAAGISLHASSKYKDQRQRTMIFAQMQGNINDEVQIRGRIDRTGQVRRGKYVYLVSAIPAEQRLMMMFKNKLKSLDANTTSSQKSKFNEVDVQDFTNKYGDEIVLQYMAQHPEYYNKLADPLGWGFMEYARDGLSIGELKSGMKPNITSPAYEVMKRLTLLPVKEQEVVLKDISDSYSQKIKQLNDMGMNDLEMTDMPLDAKTLKREVWKEGSDPNGDNAFADNTYIETVEMNVLKKPMKAEEVEDAQKKMLDGKDYETWRKDKVAEIRAAQQAKIEDTKAKMSAQKEKKVAKVEESTRLALEKENAKIQKKIDKGEEIKPGEHILTEEEIKTRVDTAVDDVKRRLSKKLSDAIENVNVKYDMFVNPLFAFDPNKTISVPNDWYMEEASISLYPEFGRIIGFKFDKNYNLGSSSIVIATTDSRKRVEIPLNRPAVLERIQADSERFSKECKVVNMDAWDRMIPKKDRTIGRIITGNMLEALADNSSIGHLISYTTDDGKVKQGILVPDGVSIAEITGNMPIAKAYDWFTKKTSGTELASTDGTLRLTKNSGSMYALFVPASRKEGGKYYLNQYLLDLVHGRNFQSKGKNFWATFDAEKLKDVLNVLNGMGVEVKTPYDYSESDTHFREERGDGNYPASSVEIHVEKVAQKTGGKVKMVSSVDEITNKAAKAAIEEGRKITGWYDENTGEVHLYMPNIHDRYTAEKTIWHEVVGHKGMRELFGEERFDKFLDSVWYDLDKPENAGLKKLVAEEMKYSPLDYRNAIEEGIARLAEDGKGEAGFWNGIKNKVSDFLHEIGYRIAPNTKDVKYLLWLSKNLQKNPNDPYWKLRAEAVKYRLDHEDIRSVVSRDGVFYENDGKARSLADLPKADYQEATDGQIHFRTTPTAATALDRYHRSLDAHGYMATESYMDNMLSLKKLMNAIVPDKKIEDIASSENPYILQNVMQGAMSDAAKMFEINIMRPLEKAMAGVLDAFEGKKTDDKIRNFNLYMITKHGLERNRVFFVRDAVRKLRMDDSTKADAEKLQSEWVAKKEDLGNQLKSGIIDLKRYYEKMDEWIRDNVNKDYEAGEHDYSGMHGVQDIISMKDPYNDGEAIQSVMDAEAKMESVKAGSVRDYWDKVRAATRYSVDSDYNNGIIDRDLHGHVSKMFDWYVPLRNYDEKTAEDVYGYITEIGDPKNRIGSTLAKARGHKYLSETNILAQIGALGNRAIKNGGDNAIKQAFARFARNHSDNNLIKETSVWYVKDPTTGIVEERYPDIPEGATADEINQIVSDFDTDMAMLKAQGLATKKFDRGNIGYRFERAKDKSQHIVDVMIAGKKHSFVILGNPRAAQALNGMLEHKNESLVGRTTAAISRFMAQTCTSYNPEFVMRNMIRDFEFASTNLLAKEGMAYTKTFEKYYAQVGLIEGIRNTKLSDFKKMTGFGLFSKYRNGTLDNSDKIQRYFKEFMENGGETGWVQIKNMKDLTSEYKLHVKTEKNGKARVSKNVFDFIFKNLENANEVAENLARFATYCASRDAGRSTVRSAYDAKEVSVNFNRHGSGNAIYSFKNGEMSKAKTARKNVYGFWASWFRNSSMFFNAGVQSTNLLIKNFKNNKAGTIGYIMAGPMMSGMAMALINNMLIASEDEKDRKGVKDPYGELPDYIRRNNLCIYVGGGEFITIPLAIEERAFYGLGDLAAGLTFSKNISGQKNPALDAVGCMSQLVPVADYLGNASFGKNPGEETIKAIAPSATSPIFEWFFNSDWKGAPIHRENKFDENQPSWMLAYKGTPEWLININKKANAWSNDVAPGNENMKGNDFLDAATDPSLLQHLYSSYLGGAATFMERVGGLVKKGNNTETKDIPFVRSLFYTPSEQTSLQRTKSKWYNYLDETEKMIANAKRLKSKNVPLDEMVKNYGDYYKFKQSKGAEKMNVIETATKEMKRWRELRNKSNDAESINFANQNIDYIMMRAVDELDKLN
jgi:hypothetical protein